MFARPTGQQLGGMVTAARYSAEAEASGRQPRRRLTPEERVAVGSACPWRDLSAEERLVRGKAESQARQALVRELAAEQSKVATLQAQSELDMAELRQLRLDKWKQPMPSAAHGQVGSGAHVLAHRCRSRDASCALSCAPLLSAVGPVAVLRARGTFLLCVWSVCDYVVA